MNNRKHIFTPSEKKNFLEIIKKYKTVVENKNTDGASLQLKNEAWDKIAAEFNASPHAFRQASSKQLRRLWLNLKQRQREALTKERQHRLATGGGPSISDAIIDPDVAEVAPALLVGVDSAIDSDTILEITEPIERSDTIEVEEVAVTPFLEPVEVRVINEEVAAPASQIAHDDLPQRRPPVLTGQRPKDSILEREYKDCQMRANEKHALEMQLLHEQRREATVKAELAELILRQHQQRSTD